MGCLTPVLFAALVIQLKASLDNAQLDRREQRQNVDSRTKVQIKFVHSVVSLFLNSGLANSHQGLLLMAPDTSGNHISPACYILSRPLNLKMAQNYIERKPRCDPEHQILESRISHLEVLYASKRYWNQAPCAQDAHKCYVRLRINVAH